MIFEAELTAARQRQSEFAAALLRYREAREQAERERNESIHYLEMFENYLATARLLDAPFHAAEEPDGGSREIDPNDHRRHDRIRLNWSRHIDRWTRILTDLDRQIRRLEDRKFRLDLWILEKEEAWAKLDPAVLKEQIRQVVLDAEEIAPFVLGRPVEIAFDTRPGAPLGHVPIHPDHKNSRKVFLTAALFEEQPEHLLDFYRALLVHEMGHLLLHLKNDDYRRLRRLMRRHITLAPGFFDVFNILLDQQLERILRDTKPQWQAWFNRLDFHARRIPLHDLRGFLIEAGKDDPEAVIADLAARRLIKVYSDPKKPFAVILSGAIFSELPYSRIYAFHAVFANKLPLASIREPWLVEALALIPKDFKTRTVFEVHALAVEIYKILMPGTPPASFLTVEFEQPGGAAPVKVAIPGAWSSERGPIALVKESRKRKRRARRRRGDDPPGSQTPPNDPTNTPNPEGDPVPPPPPPPPPEPPPRRERRPDIHLATSSRRGKRLKGLSWYDLKHAQGRGRGDRPLGSPGKHHRPLGMRRKEKDRSPVKTALKPSPAPRTQKLRSLPNVGQPGKKSRKAPIKPARKKPAAPMVKRPPLPKPPPPPRQPTEADRAERLAAETIPNWTPQSPAGLTTVLAKLLAEVQAELAGKPPEVPIDRILPEGGKPSDTRNETDVRLFPKPEKVLRLIPDRRASAELAREVRPLVPLLRPYLAVIEVDKTPHERLPVGRRLLSGGLAKHLAYGETRLFADQRLAEIEQHRDVLLAVLIDTSASMQTDDRLPRARRLAALLAGCLTDCPHVETVFLAYNQNVYRCGDHDEPALTGLAPAGKTNEAGALDYLREHHLARPRRRRGVVVLSEELPPECSMESVRWLVRTLEKELGARFLYGALSGSDHPAYRRRVDLTGDLDPIRLRSLGRALAMSLT